MRLYTGHHDSECVMNQTIGRELTEVSTAAKALSSKRTWFGRFLHSDGDTETINDMKAKLKSARENFEACTRPLLFFSFDDTCHS